MTTIVKITFVLWLTMSNMGFCHCYVENFDPCNETHQSDTITDNQDESDTSHDCQCATCHAVHQSYTVQEVSQRAPSAKDHRLGELVEWQNDVNIDQQSPPPKKA